MSYFIRTKIVCFLFGVLFVICAFFVDLVKHKRIAELYVECEYIQHILYIDIELTTNTHLIDERQIYMRRGLVPGQKVAATKELTSNF